MREKYDFQIASINVRGLGDYRKRTSVYNWLHKKKIDIIYLQETHSTEQNEQLWKNQWRGKTYMSHGTNNSKGCMILFRQNLDIDIQQVITDDEGRYVIVDCNIMDERFILVNIYAPNTENGQIIYISDLEQTLTDLGFSSAQNFIIGGDWNFVRDASVDKHGGLDRIKQKSIDQMDILMNNLCLNDSWRIRNPLERRYTWRQKSPLIQCRLDYWLLSDSLFDNITHIDTIPSIQTDHSAIVLKLKYIEEGKGGQGLWKFNTSLLDNVNFINVLRLKIEE